jgi:hypothetical protein
MEKHELNKYSRLRSRSNDGKSNNYWTAMYFDELTWRLIYRLIRDLFRYNKFAMTSIIASAAANHATHAVMETVHTVEKKLIEEVYNYNVKTAFTGIAHQAKKALYVSRYFSMTIFIDL